MDAALYDRFFAVEDWYWWSVGTRRVFVDWLRRALPAGGAVLDLGCGTGALAAELAALGTVTGVDLSPDAVRYCRRRALGRLCVARGEALPFRNDSFDAVAAVDVVEHADDVRLLAEIRRVVRPGGVALVHVPAFPFLWSEHDEANHHLRRYWPARLRDVVTGSGLRVERVSFFNCLLFPAALAVRLGKRLVRRAGRPPRAEIFTLPRWANRTLVGLLAAEGAALRVANLPVGVSLLCLARKP